MAKAVRVIGTVVGVAVTVAGVVTGNPALVAAGLKVAAYSNIAASAIDIVAPRKPKFSDQGNPLNFQTNPQSGLPYCIGRTRMSGVRIYADTYDGFKIKGEHDVLSFGVLLSSGGAIDSIEKFTADGEQITFNGTTGNGNGTWTDWMGQKVWLGGQQSTALSLSFGGKTPPGWTGNHKLSGITHALWSLRYDNEGKKYAAGVPEPAWIGKWVKVYDPRLDSTYPGGSGSCRPLQEGTYVWSRNPALHALTWALGRWQNGKRTLGIGAPIANIRVADFVEAANVADENGWGIGGVEWSTDSKWAILKRMLQAGGAVPTQTGAMIGCRVNMPRIPVTTITSADLLDEISVAVTKPRRERFNTVIPRYRSESHEWEIISADPIGVSGYVAEDGGIRQKEIDYPLVQAEVGQSGYDGDQQAGQLAAYDIVNSREAGPIVWTTGPKFIGLKSGDCVTLDVPEQGLVDQDVLITGVERDPGTAKLRFTANTETADKHAFALGETAVPPPPFSLTPPAIIPEQPDADDWDVSPDKTADGVPLLRIEGDTTEVGWESVSIHYRITSGGDWIIAGSFPIEGSAFSYEIIGLDGETEYDVRLAYKSPYAVGDWLEIGPVETPAITVSDAAAQATNSTNLYRVEMAGYVRTDNPPSAQGYHYGESLGGAIYRVDLDEVGVAVGDEISASIVWSLTQAGTGQLRLAFRDAANNFLRSALGPTVTTPVTNHLSTVPGAVRASGERYVQIFVATGQSGGTLTMSKGMINRGPIAAPYVAPTRGATHGSTWDQVTGAGKPEDGATRNAYQGVHNDANTYAKGDIVILSDGTKSYLAKQNVPASTLITNTAYWGLLVEGGGGAAGEAGYSAILSNQSHVVATASDGSGGDYSDAGGQMSIYEGTTNRTGSATFAKVGAGSWYSINSAGVYTISDPGTDDATCQFDATYGSVTLRLTYSISKSKGGATAKAVKVTRTREVITYDGTGALAPSTQTTTFNAVLQNSSATVNWSATDLAGNAITPVTNLLSAATGASVTMTAANFETRRGATNGVVITASISDGGTHSDVVSVIKVQDGAVGAGAYSLVQSASNRLDLSVPGTIRKTGGNGWNNGWRTAAPYTGGVQASFRVPDVAGISTFVGFDTTDTLYEDEDTYNHLDYTVQVQTNGAIARRVNGSSTTIAAAGTVQDGDTVTISYDGKVGRIFHGNALVDTYAAIADDQTYYVKGVIHTSGGRIEALTIVPAGRAGDAGAPGAPGSPGAAGTPAPSIEVSRKAVGLWAYANGNVVSYADAAGLLKVRSGFDDVTAAATLSATPSSGVTGTINTAANTPVSGQPKGYYRVTGMTGDTGTLTLTAVSGGVTLTETFSLSKQKGGYEIVSSLPGSDLFEGRIVFLTTDDKLYRYTGSAWTAAVPATDISGTLADAQIAALAASKLTGQITSTQITDGGVTTPKIATGAVEAGKIATGAVTTIKLDALAVTAEKVAANAITAPKIAAGAITTDKLDAGAVTAAKINVTSLSAITATIGLLRTAPSGGRLEIEDNVIRVYDDDDNLRVVLGDLS